MKSQDVNLQTVICKAREEAHKSPKCYSAPTMGRSSLASLLACLQPRKEPVAFLSWPREKERERERERRDRERERDMEHLSQFWPSARVLPLPLCPLIPFQYSLIFSGIKWGRCPPSLRSRIATTAWLSVQP